MCSDSCQFNLWTVIRGLVRGGYTQQRDGLVDYLASL